MQSTKTNNVAMHRSAPAVRTVCTAAPLAHYRDIDPNDIPISPPEN